MLKKLKRPGQYINHGAWIYLENGQVVKKKISTVEFCFFQDGDWIVKKLFFYNDQKPYLPDVCFWTRKEAEVASVEFLKHHKQRLENRIQSNEFQRMIFTNALESNRNELQQVENIISKIEKRCIHES